MRALTPADILRVWEEGEPRHPLDRALLPLAAALPDWSWSELAALSIGRRDGLLLALRARTIGPKLEMLASCPHCRELTEFEAQAEELMVVDAFREPARPEPLASGQTFRRLDSTVLARAATGPRERARSTLAVCAGDLPAVDDDALAQLADGLAQADPQAEILFGLVCPACGHGWSALFDIADYFWREMAGLARRLLDEVRELAVHYGWSEAEVVAMSPVRRRHYIERARA